MDFELLAAIVVASIGFILVAFAKPILGLSRRLGDRNAGTTAGLISTRVAGTVVLILGVILILALQ